MPDATAPGAGPGWPAIVAAAAVTAAACRPSMLGVVRERNSRSVGRRNSYYNSASTSTDASGAVPAFTDAGGRAEARRRATGRVPRG